MQKGLIKCPKCGSQARTEQYRSVTAILSEPGYYDENGKYHKEPDPNTTSILWRCRECGHDYMSYIQEGKSYQVR